MASQGISIHLGLNRVDADSYGGWDGSLVACEFDAEDMASLAEDRDFRTRSLLTVQATSAALLEALSDAAETLQDQDILLVTYSGHGGQVPDLNGDDPDQMDETWVLYDRQVVDDELFACWARFKPGVRIAMFSDSCHSGSVARELPNTVRPEALARVLGDGPPRIKAMPTEVAERDYETRKAVYDQIQQDVPPIGSADIGASVILISGCQDNQTSADGARNGLFTEMLRQVWDGGQFRGGYRSFRNRIAKRMPQWQSPNFFHTGAPSRAFERQRPFTI
jgi:metacaspase-1